MAMNITEVRLCAVPLENDYKHTLYFPDKSTQTAFFQGKTKHSSTNFSYQRKDNIIRFPKQFDEISNCNYVMYKNSAYTDKWFYAFITDMQYVNDERTDISIETDVLQTYMFDYTVHPSFVEREHVDDDTRGLHLLEENLQKGEYVCNLHAKAGWGDSTYYIVVGVSKVKVRVEAEEGAQWNWLLDLLGKGETWAQISGGKYDGLYSSVAYRAFKYDDTGINSLFNLLCWYDAEGHGEDVQAMFLAPASLIEFTTAPLGLHPEDNFGGWVKTTSGPDTKDINNPGTENDHSLITMYNGSIDGYTPRNNKLLTFPYTFLNVSNNSGVTTLYHFEDFHNPGSNIIFQPRFTIQGCLCPGCSVRMVPLNYKGASRNDDEGINGGKFPALNWSSDMYTNWLTQNAVNIGIDTTSGLLQMAAGVAAIAAAPSTGGMSLALAGGVVGGATSIANTMAEVNKAGYMPAQVKGNTNAGDIITMTGENDFHFYTMSIKNQYAKIIDSYFDMFGYKVNSVKVPNKAHRQAYWFTKTIDVSIDGAIPMKDMQKIKECYNNGVTFWRSTATVGDYSQSNTIL